MSQMSHVPDDLLQSFVSGEVGEQLAVHIATHVDECPSCATRAAALEPLASVFAAVEDPRTPEGLAERIVARIDEPERTPLIEIAVGGGLLVAAAILFALVGEPLSIAIRLGAVADVLPILGKGLLSSTSQSTVMLAAAAVFCGVAVAIVAQRSRMAGRTS